MKKIKKFVSDNVMALISISVTTLFTILSFTIGWYWATILFIISLFTAIVLVVTKDEINDRKKVS